MKNSKTSKKVKRKIYFPTFTLLIALIFGFIACLELRFYKQLKNDYTAEIIGFVDREGEGLLRGKKQTTEGRYLGTGKSGRYWVEIKVNTDDKFKINTLYAGRGYGREGDKLVIHYNPENPEDYYIEGYLEETKYTVITLFVIAGIPLALSIFLMIFYTVKGGDDETAGPDKKKDKEAKREEAREKRKNKMDRMAKPFTKDYTNPDIRKQIQSDYLSARMSSLLFIIGLALILSGFIRTCLDVYTEYTVPFNNYSDKLNDDFYSVVISEKPVNVYGSFNDLKVGDNHILAAHLDERKIKGMDRPVKLRGKIKKIRVSEEDIREAVKDYYQKIGYLDFLKDEEYAYYYLDCTKVNLWEEFKNNHVLGLVFGLTIIICSFVGVRETLNMIRFIKPAFSGKKYTAREIDGLVNDPYTVHYEQIGVFVTYSSLIGYYRGMAVADYSDIADIKVEDVSHSDKHKKWTTYRIYVETQKGKRFLLTESESRTVSYSLRPFLKEKGYI